MAIAALWSVSKTFRICLFCIFAYF